MTLQTFSNLTLVGNMSRHAHVCWLGQVVN